MISGSVKTFERLSTAREPMAKLKSLVRAETPILLSAGFILLGPSSMSYAGAGYRRRAAKPERARKLPCGLPSSATAKFSQRRAGPTLARALGPTPDLPMLGPPKRHTVTVRQR